ncbi:tetraketide alpha-pyrone reductase 2 [Colletotrichum spaethianum]|uniref:Tetraketide alpha-pyrone reductase 2 n=1 Tax=Colletotrichum spaethianum TaxID=700344 RepID=A0AA37LJK6_9PEZI|nr:tetraketide alpha-pyrone reductase 2 [Colletotrichum spaethianum]GKT45252.1 tetraketide alpha-pyrone reductase 2 [Colletotrichum spaethianum]
MADIQTHLVTGGSGFIAQHLINGLLLKGFCVHTTVRSLNNAKKVEALKALQENYPAGRLKLFEADLLKWGSFKEAMQQCTVVHHVASPFMMAEKIKDGQKECVEPALKGTQNVLATVGETESVKRVVLTSTIGAIFGDYADVQDEMAGTLSEKYFNETSTVEHNPYHYSKVLAEKEAWKIAKQQDRWDMVVICPGLVLGPPLSKGSDSGSLYLIDELLRGELFFGVPNINFATVDVRDVATAHIKAAETPSANGRYIVAAKEMATFLEVSRLFRRLSKSPVVPNHQLPDFLVRLVGPLFGLTQKWISRNLGVRFTVDNSRTITELNIDFRPLEKTLTDHYQAWKASRK